MKKIFSILLIATVVLANAVFVLPIQAENAVTLNTKDTNTLVDLTALGLPGSSHTIAQNETLSFQLIVPESVASKYITILRSTAAGCKVKMDVVTASGGVVFSKTQEMMNKNDLFAGILGQAKDLDGAVMELAAGTYTVTLTNTSESAFGFVSLEFRNVILPIGNEPTAYHVTDGFYQYNLFWHTANYAAISNAAPEGIKVVGGSNFYNTLMQSVQGAVMRYYIYAEASGKYEFSVRSKGTGGFSVKANNDTELLVNDKQTVTYDWQFVTATAPIFLKKGLNTLQFWAVNGGDTSADCFTLKPVQNLPVQDEFTVNSEDTHTTITANKVMGMGDYYDIGQGENLSFRLIVPESDASKYIAILRGGTTGQVLNLGITDLEGETIFSKLQDITLVNSIFSGVSGQGKDLDGGVIELDAGTYNVTLTNTSNTTYRFHSLEFRDIILPLGNGLTAFHVTDNYYQSLLWWHKSRFETPQRAPEGAVSVGGEEYYSICMQQNQSPNVRFYVYAQTAGTYEFSVRTRGAGGIVAAVNDNTPFTVMAQTTDTYDWRLDKYDGTVPLKQGLNEIIFSGGGPSGGGNETIFDCFMLERVESVWQQEQALYVTDVQNDSISIAWKLRTSENVASFDIFKNGQKLDSMARDTTTYTFSGLEPSTSYELAVKITFASASNFDAERSITVSTGNFLARENAFTQISAGRSHFIGINKNGRLQSFGSNNHGQASTLLNAEIKAVESGASSSYAVDVNGDVYSWGSNFYGQLGLGTEKLSVDAPVKVNGLSNVTQLAAGAEHALALTDSGKVYAWGNNRYGQLGTGNMVTKTQENKPVLVDSLTGKGIVTIGAGTDTSYAVSEDGTLYSWGANYLGQLGDGNDALDNRDLPNAVTISEMKVLSVAGGGSHTVALCYKDSNGNNLYDTEEAKSVFVWGSDTRAQLGFGDLGQWINTPKRQTALDGIDIVAVAAGDAHTLALASDGTIYSWGWNEEGQLGIGMAAYGYVPAKVYNIPRITAITAGYAYSVALAEDGRTYAWGNNVMQQITNSSQAFFNSPIVVNLPLDDISIGDVTFKNASEETENMPQNGGVYTVFTNCYNDSGSDFEGVVRICAYQLFDEKPQLLSTVSVSVSVDTKKQESLSAEITLPEEIENVIIKIFAWDSEVTPYSRAAIVK